MALPDTPQELMMNVRASERFRNTRLAVFEKSVKAYHSPFFANDLGNDDELDYNPENHTYELVSYMVPQLVYNNPRVVVSTRRNEHRTVAQGLQYALNRWIADNNLAQNLEGVAHDMLFNYGVLHITETDNPSVGLFDAGSSPLWPKLERVSQKRFIRDHMALSMEECRYMGHQWIIDKEDLLQMAEDGEDDGWLPDVVAGLPTGFGTDSSLRNQSGDDDPDRKEVVIYDIWVPEHQGTESKEDGFNGTIYTIAVATGADESEVIDFVREPRDFYGPRWGPYAVADVWKVPDDPYGLSPLVATEGQARDLNRHARASSDMAARYKRMILVDNTDGDLVEKIQYGENDLVIPISGIEKDKVIQIELAGITAHELSYLQLARDRLDRNSGLSEAKRGNASQGATATAEAIADEALDIRTDYMKQKFHRMVQQALKTVAWYIAMNDQVRIALHPSEGQALGVEVPEAGPVMYQGGDLTPIRGGGFDDLEISIEPMSMERVTEGTSQQRAMRMFEFIGQAVQMIPMAPGVNWKELISTIGNAFNMPRLGELIDVDLQMQAGGMQSQEPGQPSFSKNDTSKAKNVSVKQPSFNLQPQSPRVTPSAPATPDVETVKSRVL